MAGTDLVNIRFQHGLVRSTFDDPRTEHAPNPHPIFGYAYGKSDTTRK